MKTVSCDKVFRGKKQGGGRETERSQHDSNQRACKASLPPAGMTLGVICGLLCQRKKRREEEEDEQERDYEAEKQQEEEEEDNDNDSCRAAYKRTFNSQEA